MKLHEFQLVSRNLFQKMLTVKYFLQTYLLKKILFLGLWKIASISKLKSYVTVTDFTDAKISSIYLFFYQIKGVKASSVLKNSYLKSISKRHTCNMKLNYHIYQNSSLYYYSISKSKIAAKANQNRERTAPLLAFAEFLLKAMQLSSRGKSLSWANIWYHIFNQVIKMHFKKRFSTCELLHNYRYVPIAMIQRCVR